jgi:hypothetical protein
MKQRETDEEPGRRDEPARRHPAAPLHPLLALQRSAGNNAVARLAARGVLARMPTLQAWNEARARYPTMQMTPYLSGVEAAFQRWHAISAGGATQAEQMEQLQVLGDIETRAKTLFGQPDVDTMPSHVKWVIMDMESQAPGDRQSRLGQPGYRQALHELTRNAHLADRAQLLQWVDEGLHHPWDRRLRNSCQWVRTDPRRVRLFLLTETGDRAERLQAATMNLESAAAFFPNPYGAAAWDLFQPVPAQVYNHAAPTTADPNVYLRPDSRNDVGWNVSGDVIVVLHAAMETGRDYIWETLRHEVQHDADHHTRESIERYKTEYRAYSYEGNPAYVSLDNTVKSVIEPDPDTPSVTYAFTARQHRIFSSIKSGYPHTADGWRDNPTLPSGRTFRQEVEAYVDPDTEAVNRFNSRRLDELYRLAVKVTADGNEGSAEFQTLLATCFGGGTALDRDDVHEALQAGSAMRTHWERYLVGAARTAFVKACEARLRVPTTFHLRYFTRPGENVLVCGSTPELGAWNTSQAVHMNHSGHEEWDVTLPVRYPHHYEYKYFVRRDSGEEWEGGPNRRFEVSPDYPVSRHDDQWQR